MTAPNGSASHRLQVWLVSTPEQAESLAEMLRVTPPEVLANVSIQVVTPQEAEAYFANAEIESGLGVASGMDVIGLRPR